ncbi:ATP-binding protein [Pseudomonas sp. NPDC089534]|uniref:ATP-binding protein n=1 Tax=Pseudomonas sp. NPDC089534 TaxID=3364468 RepID=UPI0037F25D6F
MLRLFLRLFLVMTVGLVLALQTVEHTFDALLDYQMQDYNREAVRGQAWTLGEQLRGLDGPGREALLQTIRPHYGLGLTLVEAGELDLTDKEKAELAQGLLVIRDKYMRYLASIDGGPQLLSIQLPGEPSLMPFYIAGAYLMVAVMIGIVLFFWVRPHWRDLEKLRLAAVRFGDNDLSARIQLSKRSNIRDLAGHFNLMAARIETLIANQRDLTNAVSHELRTPIARLSFELDQLKQQPEAGHNRELIADMYADLGELEEMVSELLTYASLERGATVINRENIQAINWLESVVGSVALEAEAAGVQLVIRECGVDEVRIEPRFMARAVINLLRNAIRYAEWRVEVSLLRIGDQYEVQVNDDGPGVPLAGREKIFEPFSRLDASRDRRTGGFGLGLALVRRVSQSHGGQVEVGDSAWGGASFRMTWAHQD